MQTVFDTFERQNLEIADSSWSLYTIISLFPWPHLVRGSSSIRLWWTSRRSNKRGKIANGIYNLMVMLVGGRDNNSPSMDLICSKIIQYFIHLLQRYCTYNPLDDFLFEMHIRASVSLIPQNWLEHLPLRRDRGHPPNVLWFHKVTYELGFLGQLYDQPVIRSSTHFVCSREEPSGYWKSKSPH